MPQQQGHHAVSKRVAISLVQVLAKHGYLAARDEANRLLSALAGSIAADNSGASQYLQAHGLWGALLDIYSTALRAAAGDDVDAHRNRCPPQLFWRKRVPNNTQH